MTASRPSKFVASVASAYMLLAANVLFTLLSLRIAGTYLGGESFGLWGVAAEAAGYFALFELGVSNALVRRFVESVDERDGRAYREAAGAAWALFSLIVVAVAVGVVVGVMLLPALLKVPQSQTGEFRLVLAVLGAGWIGIMSVRPFAIALQASHEMPAINLAAMAAFAANLMVLLAGFSLGWGIGAMVAGQMTGVLVQGGMTVAACLRRGLMPGPRRWIVPERAVLIDTLRFGFGILVINLGTSLVFFSRTMVVSAAMGLEKAGIWAALQRPFNLSYPLCWKPLEMSFSHLVELHVAGNSSLLEERFREIFRLSVALSVAAAAMLAACNQAFVAVWMGAQYSWAWTSDVLLGLLLVPLTVTRCGSWLAQATGRTKLLPHVSLAEGGLMVVAGYIGASAGGYAGALGGGLLVATFVGCSAAVVRIRLIFGLSWSRFLSEWLAPPLKMLLILIPLAGVVAMALEGRPPLFRLVLGAMVVGPTAGVLLLWLGLGPGSRATIKGQMNKLIGG